MQPLYLWEREGPAAKRWEGEGSEIQGLVEDARLWRRTLTLPLCGPLPLPEGEGL